MIENGPYILVDNRKIAPITPPSQSRAPTGDRRGPGGHPFGIVDRVTISEAARERFRQHSTGTAPAMTTPADSGRPGHRARAVPLLTYRPHRR